MNRTKKLFSAEPKNALPIDDKKIHFSASNERIYNIFYNLITRGTFVAMLAIILYYVYAFAAIYNGSTKFDWLIGIFSDFVEIMNFSLDENPYIVDGSSYPPIAIAILYPFALICKNVFARYAYTKLTIDEMTSEVILYPEFWVAILLFFFICSTLIIILCARLFGIKGKENIFKLGCIIMLSAPFIYTVMRGNTIYFALILIVAFLICKDSKNAFVRELSYIFLAMSGAIKIYPLFFGVFLLRKKKIFESFRVAIYFALIFGLSFFLFQGGVDYADNFVGNLGGFLSNEQRLLATNNISISAQLYKVIHIFSKDPTANAAVYGVTNIILLIAVFLVGTFSAITAKTNLTRYSICFAIVTLIPSISYFYTMIFAILPFLEYIRTFDTLGKAKRIFYFASFAFLFTALLVFPKFFVIHSLIIMAIFAAETATVIKELMARRIKAA